MKVLSNAAAPKSWGASVVLLSVTVSVFIEAVVAATVAMCTACSLAVTRLMLVRSSPDSKQLADLSFIPRLKINPGLLEEFVLSGPHYHVAVTRQSDTT